MSLFQKLFSRDESNSHHHTEAIQWSLITDIAQIQTIISNSKEKPQAIFKHSTRCGISRGVLKQFEKKYGENMNLDFHYLDLLAYRTISDEIAHKFQVVHQSPQVLIIHNEKVLRHDSHYDIMSIDMTTN